MPEHVSPSWLLVTALLMGWLMLLVTEVFLGGLLHLLLLAAVGIAVYNVVGPRIL